ncbi:hypothetical protein H9P43_006134 [Blastocladiella emersonii ATCC 22665]|nr:hypothetical protein H9P43_006134 [Blastocladiella emersonii ATCC 22665]
MLKDMQAEEHLRALKSFRPRPLALPRPHMALSRLDDLGPGTHGTGQASRAALHLAIEASLEDLYRELDTEDGVYAGPPADGGIGVGFGIEEDWEHGADF